MKSIKSPLLASALACAILSACSSAGDTNEPAPTANVEASTKAVALTADSDSVASLTITNKSTTITATEVAAVLPADWQDVKQDASACATLGPLASCTLTFTPGIVERAPTEVQITGKQLTPITATFSVGPATTATLFAPVSTLNLEAGLSSSTAFSIQNKSASVTASNIAAVLDGTALATAITQDAGDCTSVAPGASCVLRFTAGNGAVSPTTIAIRGTNTRSLGASIGVQLPASATLALAGSPLVLQATGTSPTAGVITITNTSTLLTATDIRADLTGTALAGAVTQDASQCANVAPGASCTLRFTPSISAVPTTAVTIQGQNTSQIGATIAVNAAAASLSVTGSPLVMIKNGAARSLTVTNTSLETANGIAADLSGTALAGHVTLSGGTCGASLAPGASCTLTLLPGSIDISATSFAITAANALTVSASAQVRTVVVGDTFGGGIVYQVPGSGLSGLIVSVDKSNDIWALTTAATPGAQSATDGVANTAAIVSQHGAGTNYSAGFCDAYSATDSTGTFSDWYMPAVQQTQALALIIHQNASAFPGFNSMFLWTSTEHSTPSNGESVRIVDQTPSFGPKTYVFPPSTVETRCIRAFN